MNEIDFFEIVSIVDNLKTRRWEIANREGAVLGKSREGEREDGAVITYGVSVDGEVFSLGVDELVRTGRRAAREDFYSGESIRVSSEGEYLGPG